MASTQADVRIPWREDTPKITRRRGMIALATLLASVLLNGCGGSSAEPTPTAGTIPTQIAPVVSAVAPVETRVATVVAPVVTRVATAVAPVETRVATVFDPIVATLEARVGGVRPTQGMCPADHSVKGRLELVPPRREYWVAGSAGYDQATATICFATEADAQMALYRRSGA